MNAVEIEAALSELAMQPFDAAEFPFAFLTAFGNKDATLKRLRAGNNNASDLPGGVLQRSNVHIQVADLGGVSAAFQQLKLSPATTKAKAKFILATDGLTLEAEELNTGETIACHYSDFPNHFGFFLPLAGISTIKEIKDNPIDVRATGRLNKLYVELLKEDPSWATEERRADMNHFMARLVFCFFAEDTDIFNGRGLFTRTIEHTSEKDASNLSEVLETIFRAMNVKPSDRSDAKPRLPAWADQFPYVNGGLFSGSTDVPKFSRMARTYLVHAGSLNWREINPDIFGSMIQAVTDDDERGSLGMHYTSVPNILKVLNPLFLDDLRQQLEDAGDNDRKLLNLRKRMSRIRVFDPACGSGNFLVIAYKQMREIEAEINRRRKESHLGSEIPLTNFRGIELRDFPAEIARLALIIAEFQCDVLYRGQKDAIAEFLPLDTQNWIVCGNSLRLDWLSICPPIGTGVKLLSDDLFSTPLIQNEIDFENEGGETFICGNPPYLGSKKQSGMQKSELQAIFQGFTTNWKSLDYVAGWFLKAAEYGQFTDSAAAFVSTNSVCQGQQVSILWQIILNRGLSIDFAHTSFKWANLATQNAGVTVVIVGITAKKNKQRRLYSSGLNSDSILKFVENINPYLVSGPNILVTPRSTPLSKLPEMSRGNSPTDGGHLIVDREELSRISNAETLVEQFIKPFFGAEEIISCNRRYCIWVDDEEKHIAYQSSFLLKKFKNVEEFRLASTKAATRAAAGWSHRFDERKPLPNSRVLAVPIRSSENREYLPVGFLEAGSVIANTAFQMLDCPLWVFTIIVSRLHLVWIATVCARLELRFSYTNTVGWNTFPLPQLTNQNKVDLSQCAENILLAREAHFPATIADLYDPEKMPENLRMAHEQNDEVLERIYIGRRFKNDTERLEKLFELYAKMTVEDKRGLSRKSTEGQKV